MNIDNSIYWDFYRSIGAEISLSDDFGVYSDIGAEVGIIDSELFGL